MKSFHSKTTAFFLVLLTYSVLAGTNDAFDCYDQGHKIPVQDLLNPGQSKNPLIPSTIIKDPSITGFIQEITPNTLVDYSFTCGLIGTMVQDSTGKEKPDSPSKEVGKSILEGIDEIFFKIAYDSVDTKKEYGFCIVNANFKDHVFGKYSLLREKLKKGPIPMGYEVCNKYGGTYYPVLNAKIHLRTVNGKNVLKIAGNYWATENESRKSPNAVCLGNKDANCQKYGALYNWVDAGSACPKGFIVPSDSDFYALSEVFSSPYNNRKSADLYLAKEFRDSNITATGLDFPLSGDISLFTRKAETIVTRKASRGQRALYKQEIPLDEDDFIIKDYSDSALVQSDRRFGTEAYYRTNSGYVVLTKEGFSRPSSSSRSQMMHTRCIQDPATIAEDTVPAYTTGTMTDPRDGKKYKTIQVDDMNWMAENLNYKVGTSVCYDNKEANCNKYGRLYNWKDASKACPEGWKLPSAGHFAFMAAIFNGLVYEGVTGMLQNKILLQGNKNPGGKGFKSSSDDWKNGGAGTDELGFNALPAGSYFDQTGFIDLGKSTAYWTSGYTKETQKHQVILLKGADDIMYQGIQSADNSALSIRCIEDTKKGGKAKGTPAASAPAKEVPAPQAKEKHKPEPQGHLTIDAKLSDKKSQAEISVTIDGVPSELGKQTLSTGPHSVKISAKCQETISADVVIKENLNTTLKKVLNPANGYLSLTAIRNQKSVKEPVFLNDKKIGITPFKGKISTCGIISIGKEKEVVPVIISENDSSSFEFDFTPPAEPVKTENDKSSNSANTIVRLPISKSIRIDYNGTAEYIDEEDFIEHLKKQRDVIEDAFQTFVNAKGTTSTSIKFRIEIDFKTGIVLNVADISREDFMKQKRHTLLFKKMAPVVSRWKFKTKKKGGTVFVEFPIKFESAK